jgi:hypothetical protein
VDNSSVQIEIFYEIHINVVFEIEYGDISVKIHKNKKQVLAGACHTTKNNNFVPGKNGNLSGGKYINFPEDFLQNDSGVKIRLK